MDIEDVRAYLQDYRVQIGLTVVILIMLGLAFFPDRFGINDQSTVQTETAENSVEAEPYEPSTTTGVSNTDDEGESTPAPEEEIVEASADPVVTPQVIPTVPAVPEEPEPVANSNITSAEQTLLLATHNAARSAVGVGPLQWSNTVALSAQAWADQLAEKESCAWRHSTTEYGENIFYSWTTNKSARRSANEPVDWWVAEKADYTYSSNSCASGKVCGHYTQVVWEDTTHVGCGKSSCTSADRFEEVWVCQYNPPGNFVGEQPY